MASEKDVMASVREWHASGSQIQEWHARGSQIQEPVPRLEQQPAVPASAPAPDDDGDITEAEEEDAGYGGLEDAALRIGRASAAFTRDAIPVVTAWTAWALDAVATLRLALGLLMRAFLIFALFRDHAGGTAGVGADIARTYIVLELLNAFVVLHDCTAKHAALAVTGTLLTYFSAAGSICNVSVALIAVRYACKLFFNWLWRSLVDFADKYHDKYHDVPE